MYLENCIESKFAEKKKETSNQMKAKATIEEMLKCYSDLNFIDQQIGFDVYIVGI